MKNSLFTILLFVSAFAFQAMGQSSANALKSLKAAMKQEIESKAKSGADPGHGGVDEAGRGRAVFDELEWVLSNGEPAAIDQVLGQVPTFFSSEEVRQQAISLRAA